MKKRDRASSFIAEEDRLNKRLLTLSLNTATAAAPNVARSSVVQRSYNEVREDVTVDGSLSSDCASTHMVTSNNQHQHSDSDESCGDGGQPIDCETSQDISSDPVVESFIRVIRGGRPRYVRRIDYLVDELIRKSARNHEVIGGMFSDGADAGIPASIGPDPLTDTRLFLTLRRAEELERQHEEKDENRERQLPLGKVNKSHEPQFNDSNETDSVSSSDTDTDSRKPRMNMSEPATAGDQVFTACLRSPGGNSISSISSRQDHKQSTPPPFDGHAGDITHSDWPIIELPIPVDHTKLYNSSRPTTAAPSTTDSEGSKDSNFQSDSSTEESSSQMST